jgi:hypothetical protein
MKRAHWTLVGIVVVAAVLVAPAVFAAQEAFTPFRPNFSLKEMYDRNVFFGGVDFGPDPMPRPAANASATYNVDAVSGPVAGVLESPDISGAIPSARGGSSMYSEKQRADQEISRLIRRLE